MLCIIFFTFFAFTKTLYHCTECSFRGLPLDPQLGLCTPAGGTVPRPSLLPLHDFLDLPLPVCLLAPVHSRACRVPGSHLVSSCCRTDGERPPAAPAIDRFLLPVGRSAANPPPAARRSCGRSTGQTDGRSDGRPTVS